MKIKIHSGHIELAVARYLDYRKNLIVPNIFWGLNFNYEIDLLVLTENNYAWEIEIKTSISDLKADFKKRHQHDSPRIKRLYFAIPSTIKDKATELIPDRAGLLIINDDPLNLWTKLEKTPKTNKQATPFTSQERLKLSELGAMRIWSLKETLYKK